MPFDQWMQKVDAELIRMIGIGSADLPHAGYYDAWENGETPHFMAVEVLASEGYPC